MRREQGLLLVVLALGVAVYTGLPSPPTRGTVASPSKGHELDEVPPAPLAPPRSSAELPSRDLFLEPSESSPLPPRSLPFPYHEPLPLVAVPLPTGPDAGHYRLLHIPGDVVQGVALDEPLGNQGPQDEPPADPSPLAMVQDRARLERLYDQVQPLGGDVFFGILETADKYALAERTVFDETVEFRLRMWERRTGRLAQGTMLFTGNEVRFVRLAKNLRNEVELRRRRLKPDLANRSDREEFLEWLLQKAREESWVYDEAARQADVLIQLTNGDLDSYRWKVRVFREQGNLEAERQLYASLPPKLVGTAFHDEGTGQLKALLGLYEDAEADLARAVGKAPNDPLILGSLAYFLLERGRPEDARPWAERARRYSNRLRPELRNRVRTVLVAAYMALGELDLARDELDSMSSLNGAGGMNSLRAALAYARGDIETADTLFRNASPESRTAVIFGLNPLLGVAACHLRAGRWQEAVQSLESVADQVPLLRHRALSGLGLLYLRIGSFDDALTALDRALVADPADAYSLYLRGRSLRMLGELSEALTSLEQALAVRDDLLEALAEMAVVYLALADEQPSREPDHLFRAMRFADRLVELDAGGSRSLHYLELQGRAHFRASDLRGAREAFTRGEAVARSEQGRLFSQVGLALVEYAQGRTQIAWGNLEDLASGRPAGDPFRDYARATIALIDEHASKEQIQDRFERAGPELGSIWGTEMDRSLRPRLIEGRMEFRGGFDSKSEVWARRQGVIPQAGRFVSVSVTIQEQDAPLGSRGFSGLRLVTAGPAGRAAAANLTIEFGLSESEPYLKIVDGRASDREPEADLPVRNLGLPALDPRQPQYLELRVEASDESRGQLILTALWNGEPVHQRALRWLRGNTRPELYLDLMVRGRAGPGKLAVSFDDFRLVRRKE